MRILHLVPGTGNFHCGACLRDEALARALTAAGHEVTLAPLYMPMVLDGSGGGRALPEIQSPPVQLGGIKLFLEQKVPVFRRAPGWVDTFLDHPLLLRAASHFAGFTAARDLGEMTVGNLKGAHGPQASAWEELLQWITTLTPAPEVVSLSNSLITGIAGPVKEALGVPVVASLQGEDVFLDTLPAPYRERAWETLSDNVRNLDRLIAPSQFYADLMAERLGAPPEKMRVVPNGVDLEVFRPAPGGALPERRSIGYLARLCHGKGLGLLVDAFILLSRRDGFGDVRLQLTGACTAADRRFVGDQKRKLKRAGLAEAVDWLPNATLEEKVRFLQGLSVLSVPTLYDEAFGLYNAETLACGVPLVLPRRGAFPEIVGEEEKAGKLVEPDSIEPLVDGLVEVLSRSSAEQRALRSAARQRAEERFDLKAQSGAFAAALQENGAGH